MRSILNLNRLLCVALLVFPIPPKVLGAVSGIFVNAQIVSTDTTDRTDNPDFEKDTVDPWAKGTWKTISDRSVIATSSKGLGSCTMNISGKPGANNTLQARTWTRKWDEYYGMKNIPQDENKVTDEIVTKTINPPIIPVSRSLPILTGVANASGGFSTQQERIITTDTAIEYRYKVAGDGYRYCTSTGDLSASVNSSDSTKIWTKPPGSVVQRINEINY